MGTQSTNPVQSDEQGAGNPATENNAASDHSIQKVQEFLDDAQEGILAVDVEGIVTYVNDSLQKQLAKSHKKEDMIGQKLNRIFGKDAEELARSMEEAHMQTLKMLSEVKKEKKDTEEKLTAMQSLFLTTAVTFIKLIESRDPYRVGHSARVARYAMMLSRKVGLSKDRVQEMAYAGIFHDMGMATVPIEILHSATKLTPSQFIEIQKHPVLSYEYLKKIEFFKPFLLDILHHHERWDGNGYPNKLKGDKIPLGAQILAVCDAFDAITSKRPYRMARSRERAIEILKEGRGSQWSPTIIDHMLYLLANKVI